MTRAEWNDGRFRVTSYGNGLSYCVAEMASGREFFLQGDDAAEWRAGYDACATDDAVESFLAESMADYGAPIEPA